MKHGEWGLSAAQIWVDRLGFLGCSKITELNPQTVGTIRMSIKDYSSLAELLVVLIDESIKNTVQTSFMYLLLPLTS